MLPSLHQSCFGLINFFFDVQADGTNPFQQLVTVMNEKNQVIKQEATQESENEHLESMLNEVLYRSTKNELPKPNLVYVDNCCHAKRAIQRGLNMHVTDLQATTETLSEAESKNLSFFDDGSEEHWQALMQGLRERARKGRLFGALKSEHHALAFRISSSLINPEESVIVDGVVTSSSDEGIERKLSELISLDVTWLSDSSTLGQVNVLQWGWRAGTLGRGADTVEQACIHLRKV